ncbi:polysaccharide biosynthesis protein [Aeribacillus composti]|uniref:Polysaccharide biosynthesis protein n=1 Tax=Aeribacillus composti TaxID=1868734 RepID=A0ABY9WFN8_9BACI|nr:polysaccharide biosynthesis protein [Aeribacillus composti]MED0702526.1 polysaccharide biosynthesis protein [Aeribacillus composti]MED0716450.1 polysaccharide biosynthesis protein [Aeribacillus composti]MED0746293.1 polysaccharide biosynthesis protein [Aeribacillus composti]TVZ89279.1 PST family polysaccharide transporter [Aeribacillus composti]WNF34012.1 polysaccharide biosynthesis protein [Aeribacillus composti]
MSDKLLRGTFILTLGTYISRILGMIYVIPFFALVGETGSALYQYGYVPYTIFLSVATMGFPMAISKFVAKYNSIGDYETSRRMFRSGMLFMLLGGIFTCFILFVTAPFFAEHQLGQQELQGVTVEDVTYVIRMVSLALIVVPIMSLIRGFFQGHQSMGPTSVSQVIEQLVRIIFLLVSSYIILKVLHGDIITAVGYATFAAFVGAIGGLFVLFLYWMKRKNSLLAMQENKIEPSGISTKQMFLEVFRYAGPFVFVGLAIPLYQFVDSFTFNKAMIQAGEGERAQELYAMVNFLVNKIVMIPVSLATAFGLTLVPAITNAFTNQNFPFVRRQIDQAFQTLMFLVLPASIGIIILSEPIYMFFYNDNETGASILAAYAPIALLFSYFTVSAAILQGINKQKLAVISLAFGLLLKICLNSWLITQFGAYGSIMATAIGFLGSLIYGLMMIRRHTGYSYKRFWKRTIFTGILVICMSIVVVAFSSLFTVFFDYHASKTNAAIMVGIAALLGAGSYFWLAKQSGFLKVIFGTRFLSKRKERG